MCETDWQKVCEVDNMVSDTFSSTFHMPYTQYNFTCVWKKRCETWMKRCDNHMKTVWNKPSFHTLFNIVFTCLLLVVSGAGMKRSIFVN